VVVPAAIPPTTPVEDMVAVPVELLLHDPPVIVSVNDAVVPVHTVGDAGEIAAGLVLTVTVLVT
jgi:hypothetical protein